MKREFSAGGVVFNNSGQVLLIKNASMKNPSKSYWGFPKGVIEPNESGKEAAVREVKEEVGVEAEIIDKVGDSKYVYTFEGEKIFKVVTIYKMRALSEEITPQADEISEAKWVTPEEALGLLSFSNDKTLLKKALEMRGK